MGHEIPAREQSVAAAWKHWLAKQRTSGDGAVPDYADPEQMNRYTWSAAHDWQVPYPGESTIFTPDEVPGAFIPSADTN